MKRIFTFLSALCLCMSLAVACTPTPDNTTPDDTENPEPKPEPEPEPEPEGRNELVRQEGYPEGMKVYYFKNFYEDGTDDFCTGYYAIVDVKKNPKLKFNAVYVEQDATPSEIFASFEGGTPLLATNGGYFWDGESLSLLISGGEVKSIAAQYTWPSFEGKSYTACPIRAAFGVHADGRMEATWVYCCPDDNNNPYSFTSAKGNNEEKGVFTSAPHKSSGGTLWTPQEAIGGGPMLLKEGKNVAETNYWKEVLHSGGTAAFSYQPRTAIGYTEDGKIVLFVCDGRKMNGSWGYTLPELADLLKKLGVVWAINLDGGGSSVMVGKDGKALNSPSDGTQRRVPTAVVISMQ
ncbi:MAG: phosphodiester glycosidase family protein [Tidjanibacter sp.]|nr:phosphodiester glycosidase family protein [Tidjanibacter sp.]